MTITCVWQGHNTLGESPLWDPRNDILYWLDITGGYLHQIDSQQQHSSHLLTEPLTSLALSNNGELIGTSYSSFVNIELSTGFLTSIRAVLEKTNSSYRFNDGKCDRQGRFWAGTLDKINYPPQGALYRLDYQHNAEKLGNGFTIANGLGWSPDSTKLYFTDSAARVIYQYDFEPGAGTLTHQQIFATVAAEAGYPDGLTVDSEGYIWSVHWDGWRITRYTPNGRIDQVIELPMQRPTSCCFGGTKLTTLYITSARQDLTMDELSQEPNAGSLWAIDTNVVGLPEPFYGSTAPY